MKKSNAEALNKFISNYLKKREAAKKTVKECPHQNLDFINGGRELRCEECEQRWFAVDKNNTPMYGWMPLAILDVLSRRRS